MAKLLDRKKDKKDKKKIIEALEKVSKLKSKANNEKSITFGDLIKQGQLPGEETESKEK